MDIHVRFALADGLYRQGSAGSMQMLVSWAKGFLSNSSSLEKIASDCQTHPPYPRLSSAEFLPKPTWRPKIVMPFTASSCYSTNHVPNPTQSGSCGRDAGLLKVWRVHGEEARTDRSYRMGARAVSSTHRCVDAVPEASEQRGLALDWLLWHHYGTDNQALVENTFRNFFETEDNRKQALRWLGSRDIEHRMQWIAEGLQSNKAGLRTEAIILQANTS